MPKAERVGIGSIDLEIGGAERLDAQAATRKGRSVASLAGGKTGRNFREARPRIALLTPYNGGNLGDAAIQDTMIANLRLRLPDAEFSGICLNCDNFVERHGTDAFPLCGITIPFCEMLQGTVTEQPKYGECIPLRPIGKSSSASAMKRVLKRLPAIGTCLVTIRACWREIRHWVRGYRFLRHHDLVIVSGGGQLNEAWGGPFGQPYALFKWALLARAARIPYAVASVGVGKVTSSLGRLLVSSALRLSRYRSYRDANTRRIAGLLLRDAAKDPVVPDLVFSLPSSELPHAANLRARSGGRPVVAISPIAYAKPRKWPSENRDLYLRYVQQMAQVISALLERHYYLVVACSSLWDDESAMSDLLSSLDDRARTRFASQACTPTVASWREFVAAVQPADVLIASRLHSAILGFVTGTPTVAISFDPKVDWVMQDLGLTDYLLQIRQFTAANVLETLDRLTRRRKLVVEQIVSYRNEIFPAAAAQYDALAALVAATHRSRH